MELDSKTKNSLVITSKVKFFYHFVEECCYGTIILSLERF